MEGDEEKSNQELLEENPEMKSPFFFFLLSLLLCAPCFADTLILKNGKKMEGRILSETPSEVRINLFFSSNPKMVYGVEAVPSKSVKKILRTSPEEEVFIERMLSISPGDLQALFDLSKWCRERKWKVLEQELLIEVLEKDPSHEGACKALGSDLLSAAQKRDPRLNPEAASLEKKVVEEEDPEEREKIYRTLKNRYGCDKPLVHLERIARSQKQPRGETLDRPLTLSSEEVKGVYSLYVPEEYNPWKAYPFVLGLHGGGVGGKDRDAVVGNGKNALAKYIHQARSRGYIVACPTAIRSPWEAPVNEAFLSALIEEIKVLYNIDCNRIYLVGHSMGGGGTWHFGPRFAELFAAIAPLASYRPQGLSTLKKTRTPVYIYHGENDPICPVEPIRVAARQLQDMEADFVYTEIPDSGHGYPSFVDKEVFDFFDRKRLHVSRSSGKRGTYYPELLSRSSFLSKETPLEKKYFGDGSSTGLVHKDPSKERRTLLNELVLGGGKGERAAEALLKLKDLAALPSLEKILKNPKSPRDVRCLAARVLGGLGGEEAMKSLSAGLQGGDPFVIKAVADAVKVAASPEGIPTLIKGLKMTGAYFDSKIVNKNFMHFSDWDTAAQTARALVEALGRLGDPKSMPAIQEVAVEKMLLNRLEIGSSDRAGLNPGKVRRDLCHAILDSLEKLGSSEVEPILKSMAGFFQDALITARTEEVIDSIKKRASEKE